MLTPEGMTRLEADEGKRLLVYDDATGEPLKPGDTLKGWPTIAIGRNLASRGLTDAECYDLLHNDLMSMWADLTVCLPWIASLDPVRIDVVLMVEFNTGNVFAFRNMLSALAKGDWKTASEQLLDSKAATQGPARYKRMAEALLTGSWKVAPDATWVPVPKL